MARGQGNKRKTTSKKKISEEEKQQRQQVFGAFFMVLAILFFVSLLSVQMGLFGKIAKQVLEFSFGKGSYAFSGLLFLAGLVLISHDLPSHKWKYLFFLASLFLSLLCIFHMYATEAMDWHKRFDTFGAKPTDGGILGAILGGFFMSFLGRVGTWILIVSIFIFAINLTFSKKQKRDFKLNFKGFISGIWEKIKSSLKKNSSEIQNMAKSSKHGKNQNPRSREVKKKSFGQENLNEFEPKIIDYRPTTAQKKKTETLNEEEKKEFEKQTLLEEIQDNYIYPSLDLLEDYEIPDVGSNEYVRMNAKIIEDTMENFNIDCKVSAINRGPSITCYEVQPAPGVRLNKIVALSDNLSLSLASPEIRIEAPIPGKSAVGIEVPNKNKDSVGLKEILESSEFQSIETTVPLTLGKDVSGKTIVSSIEKMPHLLIAGATGSGKSVCINTILMSILFKSSPSEVRLILIDPKVVELGVYNNIPHLLIPVVTDPKKAAFALSWAVDEMEKRYKKFAEEGVRDIIGYNNKIESGHVETQKMSRIVIVVDELSDLMMVAAKEVEDYITRLAQMARAAGIHLILATQRPSVDVITGTIKANIPSRIAFSVSSQIDSRTILDMGGAEKLLGKGDMLFYPSAYPKPKRLQGAFVSDEEVEGVLDFIKSTGQKEEYNEEAVEAMEMKQKKELSEQDALLNEAIKIVVTQEQASISFLQRKLKVGYSRAARIVDQMEEMGIIGPHEGSKPRKLLLSEDEIKSYLETEENV